MDAIARNSRWTRKPVLNDDGKPAVARLTPHDIEIFKLLTRYRYLSILDIHAIVGGYLKHLSHRLSLLSREPNLFVRRPTQQRENANANYMPLVYELDSKGATVLSQYGIAVPRKEPPYSFVHELMACQIMHSVELGVRATGTARLIEWPEISDRLPSATKKLSTPTSIAVTLDDKEKHVRADWTPFGIERNGEDGSTFVFFPGIEADCGTEPIESSSADRSSVHSKLLAYAAIAEQRLYKEHFGFPNFFVPIVTTTTVRMSSMMRHLQKLVEQGRIRRSEAAIFLFKTFPTLHSYGARQPVNGRMFSEPWHRAAHEPFWIGK